MLARLWGRKHGISLLIPTQNSEQTVRLCVESFARFADEVIVVDNGSTDGTLEVLSQLEREYPHVQVFNEPSLKDLYENRQFALSKSSYSWIVRIDSDYVAYTSGEYDIHGLREFLLNQKISLFPKAYSTLMINVAGSFNRTFLRDRKPGDEDRDLVVQSLPVRVVRWFPFLKFVRMGRWEGVRFQKYLKTKALDRPYWMHLHKFQSKESLLFRSERTNWRELGDFKQYPSLKSYVEMKIVERFGVSDIREAACIHYEKCVEPKFAPYDPMKYFPYPEKVQEFISNDEASRTPNQK